MSLYYEYPPIIRKLNKACNVIEASAGTGKTYTLEHLVVELLLEHPELSLDQVLIVTYTERATGELVRKVRGLLERLLSGKNCSGEESESCWDLTGKEGRLEELLFSFDTASIFTIHGFCKRVLDDHALHTGRLFSLDIAGSGELFDEAYRDMLRSALADKDSLPAILFRRYFEESGCKPNTVRDLLFKAFTAYRSVDPDDAPLTFNPKWERKLGQIEGWEVPPQDEQAEQADGDVEPLSLASAFTQEFLPLIEERMAAIKNERGVIDYQDMLVGVWSALQHDADGSLLRALRTQYRCALIDEFQDTDPVQWKIFSRIFRESDEGHRLFLIGDPKQAIYGFRGADVRTYEWAKREIINKRGAFEQLPVNFRSSGELVAAYNEIFGLTEDGKRVRPDQKKAENVEPYFTDGIRYDAEVSVSEKPPRAETHNGAPLKPVRILHLDDSEEPNDGAKNGDNPDPATALTPPSRAKKGTKHGRTEKDDRYDLLLRRRMAKEIRCLIDKPIRWRKDGDTESLSLLPKDIFILTRANYEGREVAKQLAEANVPYAFYKEEGLFKTEAADEIRRLLLAIADPSDRGKCLGAFSTRFFGVPWGELVLYRNLAETHDYMVWLKQWKAMAQKRKFTELFQDVLHKTKLFERELFFEESLRDLTDYGHIFEILAQTAETRKCDLEELARLLANWCEGIGIPGGDDGDTRRVEVEIDPENRDRRGAVQIMTLHRSKGLQAPVVFLYGGFGGSGVSGMVHVYHDKADDGRPRRRIVIAKAERGEVPGPIENLGRKLQAASIAEDERLYYVGLTRAQVLLYLPCLPQDAGSYFPIARRVHEIVAAHHGEREKGDRWDELFEVLTFRPQDTAPADGKAMAIESLPAANADADADDDSATKKYEALKAARAAPKIKSFSGLGHSASVVAEAEDHGSDEDDAALVAENLALVPPGKNTGIFLHSILEQLPFASFQGNVEYETWKAREDVSQVFEAHFERFALTEAGQEEVRRMCWNGLTMPLGSMPLGDWEGKAVRLADAELLLREPEFFYPWGQGEKRYLKGYIDFIFQHGGKLYLGDWKGNWLEEGYGTKQLQAAMNKRNYYTQGLIYGQAVLKLFGITEENYDRFGGYVYVFLRGLNGDGVRGVYPCRPKWAELQKYGTAARVEDDHEPALVGA